MTSIRDRLMTVSGVPLFVTIIAFSGISKSRVEAVSGKYTYEDTEFIILQKLINFFL